MPTSIIVITAMSYAALAGFFGYRLSNPSKTLPKWNKFLPFVPAILHCYFLYLAIETGDGQNLSLFNVLSLTALIVVLLVSLYRFKYQTPHLMLYVCIFAAIAVLLSFIPHKAVIYPLKGDTISILHIWLAIISFSLLVMAALQSLFTLMLHKKLRSNPTSIHPLMPPLQQIETLNFDIVLAGVVALTLSLILGFFLPPEVIKSQVTHKIVLSIIAWFSFCTFIALYKTRRISAIQFARLTLIGFSLLALGFLGSKLVIEFILNRG